MPERVSVPLAAVRVTWTALAPASTSATPMTLPLAALKRRAVSSAVVWAAGTVLTGASLTAVTAIELVAMLLRLLSACPSLTWKATVRAAGLGFSLAFSKVTARRAAW